MNQFKFDVPAAESTRVPVPHLEADVVEEICSTAPTVNATPDELAEQPEAVTFTE